MSDNYNFVAHNYLFSNDLAFPVTYDVMMNVSSEATVCKCSSKEIFSKILQYSQENVCVGVSFGVRPEGLQLY